MKPRRRRSQTIPLAAVHTDAIGWGPSGSVQVLDQTVLPGEVRYLELQTVDALVEAGRVRGGGGWGRGRPPERPPPHGSLNACAPRRRPFGTRMRRCARPSAG